MATYDGFYHLTSNDLSTWDDPEIDKAKMQNTSLAVGEFSTTGMELLFENYPKWHETWEKDKLLSSNQTWQLKLIYL